MILLNKFTFEQLNRLQGEIADYLRFYENLHKSGISYKNAFGLVSCSFYAYSGYSMGEIIELQCNGKELHKYDRRQEYAKSCKWKAKHGRVVFDFTKKDLKRLCEILTLVQKGTERNTLTREAEKALLSELKEIKQRAFSEKKSIVTKGYYVG